MYLRDIFPKKPVFPIKWPFFKKPCRTSLLRTAQKVKFGGREPTDDPGNDGLQKPFGYTTRMQTNVKKPAVFQMMMSPLAVIPTNVPLKNASFALLCPLAGPFGFCLFDGRWWPQEAPSSTKYCWSVAGAATPKPSSSTPTAEQR